MTTPAQRRNLDKLATYLEKLPPRYKHFGMGSFIRTQANSADQIDYALNNGGVNKHDCGAVACAIGHGPSAGIPVPKHFIVDDNWDPVMWGAYSTEKFADEHSNAWAWMFGGEWDEIDNGHRGAAARIRYFLKRGVPAEYEQDGPRPKHRALYKEFRV